MENKLPLTPCIAPLSKAVAQFFDRQMEAWPAARAGYAALARVQVRELQIRGVTYRLQHNPARTVSTCARVDRPSLASRPCFLCAPYRPKEQRGLTWQDYEILVNPFPIFPHHLTIATTRHQPQTIAHRLIHLLRLARELPDYTLFYNGPRCGASAPDHAHFQAGNRGMMPIEQGWRARIAATPQVWGEARLHQLDDAPRHAWVIESPSLDDAVGLFERFCTALPTDRQVGEPMLNLLALDQDGVCVLFIFPRRAHRPACYFAQGTERMLVSPGAVDLGGLFILPAEDDFRRMDEDTLEGILEEVVLKLRTKN